MNVLLPRRIGSARVLERLGEGGMAVVHRAEDLIRPDRPLAVKFLRPEAGTDPELVRRFLREGEVLKRLRHPHLVEVHDFGRVGSTPYLLMELLPGGSVKACRGEAPARVLRRLLPVMDALTYTHGEGVIHRDLKPSNLLFAADARLKVTDFGVCLWEGGEGTRVTRSQMVVGTLGYMAPEQHGDPRRVDGRCDIYAMAAILYEFATDQAYAQVQLPPAAARPGFPPGLATILMQALVADATKRTASMAEFRDQLTAWLDRAEAAGWGEEPLPGFRPQDREGATVSCRKDPEESPDARLGPYLDALQTGGVGSRRSAADGLRSSVKPGDETYLLEALSQAPDAARFALVNALGEVGGEAALTALKALLQDPFARAEAALALAAVARRLQNEPEAILALCEPGLGSPWRWSARARLGDGTWAEALRVEWPRLTPPQRLQGLEAARELPEAQRARLKAALAEEAARQGTNLRGAWEAL